MKRKISVNHMERTEADLLTWNRLMEQCLRRAKDLAHPKIFQGWNKLNLLTKTIPTIGELNNKLRQFDWEVIPVNGFLIPREYLGHVAHRRLPIAMNMRAPEKILFNPEPDVFHEVFGHLSLLADAAYGNFLSSWGKASLYAFQNPNDHSYYKNIKDTAQDKSLNLPSVSSYAIPSWENIETSEAMRLAIFGWRTVECGIIKTGISNLVYGAALLSSPKELDNFINAPETIPLGETRLDIQDDPTELQSKYYHIENIDSLLELLLLETRSMAFKTGGVPGLRVAKQSGEPAVCRLSSGRVLKGKIVDFDDTGTRLKIELLPTACERNLLETHFISKEDHIESVFPLDSERYMAWNS